MDRMPQIALSFSANLPLITKYVVGNDRARGGEAHRTDAAARHQGRTKRGREKLLSISGGLSIILNDKVPDIFR